MAMRQEFLEELLKDYKSPEDLLGQGGLLKELTKALVEKTLDGELTHYLGYLKHSVSMSVMLEMAIARRACSQIVARWRLFLLVTAIVRSSLNW